MNAREAWEKATSIRTTKSDKITRQLIESIEKSINSRVMLGEFRTKIDLNRIFLSVQITDFTINAAVNHFLGLGYSVRSHYSFSDNDSRIDNNSHLVIGW